MENINELPRPVRERIEELKQKESLQPEEVSFLKARQDYLTDEEKQKLLPKEEVKVEKIKKTRKKLTK